MDKKVSKDSHAQTTALPLFCSE